MSLIVIFIYLMPILKALYNAPRRTANQIYMLLIILLILSQDSSFNASIHKLILTGVLWYKECLLHQTSLGSLLAIILIRTIQYNLSKLREDVAIMKYMNTDAYRFSISWSRILPKGKISSGNSAPGANAWSKEGHMITCKIAQSLLEPEATEAVHHLLPEYVKGDLSALCVWPDQIKHWYKYRWTSPLHFIDTPDDSCSFSYSRDCHDQHGVKDMCVAGAVKDFTSQLLHYRVSIR